MIIGAETVDTHISKIEQTEIVLVCQIDSHLNTSSHEKSSLERKSSVSDVGEV